MRGRRAWGQAGWGDLRRHARRLDAQEASRSTRQPPVPAAEESDRGRRQDGADERGVEQDPAAEGGGEHLRLGAGAGAHGDEGEPRIRAALVTRRPVRPMPSTTAASVEPVRS